MFFLSPLSPYPFLLNFTFPPILLLVTETPCCVKWIFYFGVAFDQNSPKAWHYRRIMYQPAPPVSSQLLPRAPAEDQTTLLVPWAWGGPRHG